MPRQLKKYFHVTPLLQKLVLTVQLEMEETTEEH